MLLHLPSCLHNPSASVLVDSINKMRPIIFVRKWYSIQDAFCGSGNRWWNSVRNPVESRKLVNECDTKSAMWFLSPSTWSVVRGKAWQAVICHAKMHNNCAALAAFVNSSLEAHATVGVLSHQHATCVWVSFEKFSRTNHWKMSQPFPDLNLKWCHSDFHESPFDSGYLWKSNVPHYLGEVFF